MFWKYNTNSSSQMDALLAKEDVTLQEVMDSEDIISECRVQNKNLIDFLLKPDVMDELVTLTTREPSMEIGEKDRFKYPTVACELLTCDVPALNERLAGDERLLEKLYEFLGNEPPLNPLLASYFSKIMGGLIARKTEQNWLSYQLTCLQVLDFLKDRDTFLPFLLKNLRTSAIMDLTLKLMTQVEGVDIRHNILSWLDDHKLIQQLVCLLNPNSEKERHDNVAQLLCDFLKSARDTQNTSTERADPDPLLNTLESPETIKLLLDQIFDNEKCESSIVGGIQVLLTLLDVNNTSVRTPFFRSAASIATSIYSTNMSEEPVDLEHRQKVVRDTTEAIAFRIKDFHNLLLEPPKQCSVFTTIGLLDPPVGNTRLQIVRLLATLINSDYGQLYEQLMTLGTFTVLLDLFFKYSWNNFLHTQVENCMVIVLEAGANIDDGDTKNISPLCRHLIQDCHLLERIMKAWKDNDEQQTEKKAIRQGYMGHLISLVNTIVQIKSSTALGEQLKELKPETATELEEFIAKNLAEAIENQERLLGGQHPNNLEDNNDDFNDLPYPQNSVLQQQSFTHYQVQNLPTQYIDGYSGFSDDAFNDGDDTLQTIDNPSDNFVNFDLTENEMMQRDDLFKQVCAQSINTLFDAEDQIFEERDHTFQTVIEKKDQGEAADNSSDSDDESPPGGEDIMDVDPWSSPKADPWSTLASTTDATSDLWCEVSPTAGWANFSAASFYEKSQNSISETGLGIKEEASAVIKEEVSLEMKEEPSISTVTVESAGSISNMIVESAAAGDQLNTEESATVSDNVEGSSSNQSQPSMSLEGDKCISPIKPVENSLDEPVAHPHQDKV
ncbi:unnamed protein product [Ceutorhynchus assimilis]|uniref:Serine/threonine-protein phosphatase 6 regulatory subunit 3 n=1 Tax=Ceutorhynchus assimilis TaxID=467358 RepID=A0A9N9MI68_9CUCU|nr:unnamed protein product [Ceutorhynchus assimilis]